MFEKAIMMGLFAETPLHSGTGSTTGVVDLPVQRDIHTGFPIMQASGLKGAMREVSEKKLGENSECVNIILGPKGSEHAGAISITDARLLAFPVRSLSEVYVWVTCPMVLDRLKRDMALLNLPKDSLPTIAAAKDKAYVSEGSGLNGKIVLEEFSLAIDNSKANDIKKWIDEIIKLMPSANTHNSVKTKMEKHLVVISNDDFAHLVKTATQVSARIVLKENKTSENLWYEESLPPDTLFYTMIFAMDSRKQSKPEMKADEIVKTIKDTVCGYIQVGGNETVGMGWCAISYREEGA
jgi:CRISPR-associated protein Cmr4